MSGWGRQQWMLFVLGILVIYLGWSRLIAPNLGSSGGGAPGSRGAEFNGAEIVELRADLLRAQTGVYKRGRNVFAYVERRVQPEPVQAEPEPVVNEPQPQQAANRQPPAPKPPNFTMKYLGSFGHQDRPIAVFVDGEELYNVQVGDVVKNDFVLVAVGFESADIGYVNFPGVEPKRIGVAGS